MGLVVAQNKFDEGLYQLLLQSLSVEISTFLAPLDGHLLNSFDTDHLSGCQQLFIGFLIPLPNPKILKYIFPLLVQQHIAVHMIINNNDVCELDDFDIYVDFVDDIVDLVDDVVDQVDDIVDQVDFVDQMDDE